MIYFKFVDFWNFGLGWYWFIIQVYFFYIVWIEVCQVEVRLLLVYNFSVCILKCFWMEGGEVLLQVEISIEGIIFFSKFVKVYIMFKFVWC